MFEKDVPEIWFGDMAFYYRSNKNILKNFHFLFALFVFMYYLCTSNNNTGEHHGNAQHQQPFERSHTSHHS